MVDIEDVVQFLQEGEDWDAANILAQCEFSYDFIDLLIPLGGGSEMEAYDLKIAAPRSILKQISGDLQSVAATIEEAINQCVASTDIALGRIIWVAKLNRDTASPSDPEIEAALTNVDSEHVSRAWRKALLRRQSDPDGAITAAKTLVESVCKHILSEDSVLYLPNEDIQSLYHKVSVHLRLSPTQHIDKNVKRILGNCQAIVSGVAYLRNKLGDAHSHNSDAVTPEYADAELAVNLAGAVSMFLVRTWKSKNND